MYGTQTTFCSRRTYNQFENDVKMYGTQTGMEKDSTPLPFENDVKMYGTQTSLSCYIPLTCLRMM